MHRKYLRFNVIYALLEICHNWFSATDNSKEGNFIHTILIDYSKTFDRIDPIILIDKLKAFNIPNLPLQLNSMGQC